MSASAYRSTCRPALSAGRVALVTGACLRIDGGVPNARHTWPARAPAHASAASAAFHGFHLASPPGMLDGR